MKICYLMIAKIKLFQVQPEVKTVRMNTGKVTN